MLTFSINLKTFLFLLVLLCPYLNVNAQSKVFKEGANFIITSYDAKGKLTSTCNGRVTGVKRPSAGIEAVITNETFDAKGKLMSSREFMHKMEKEYFLIDLRTMINPLNLKGFEHMQMSVEENFMEMPMKPEQGVNLQDGYFRMTVSHEGERVAVVELKITNRKILDKEEITTPAGVFDAWKISYSTELITTTTIPLKIQTTGMDWYSPKYGILKTETFNRQGKLSSYSLLSDFNH
jgi:hypothetical protein